MSGKYKIEWSEICSRFSRELESVKFRCIDGCGYCCRESPELVSFEVSKYGTYMDKSISAGSAMGNSRKKIIDGNNRCIFLDENKKCTIYSTRPFHCGIYPVRLFISDRVQLAVDYSCPGLWRNEGSSNLGLPETIWNKISPEIEKIMGRTTADYSLFWKQVKSDRHHLDGIITSADPAHISSKIVGIATNGSSHEYGHFHKMISDFLLYIHNDDNNYYINAGLEIKSIQKKGRHAELVNYTKNEKVSIAVSKIIPAELDKDAGILFEWYANLLKDRAMTAGIIAKIADGSRYRIAIDELAAGTFTTMLADIYAIAAIISAAEGKDTIERDFMKEAIIYYEGLYYRMKFLGYMF